MKDDAAISMGRASTSCNVCGKAVSGRNGVNTIEGWVCTVPCFEVVAKRQAIIKAVQHCFACGCNKQAMNPHERCGTIHCEGMTCPVKPAEVVRWESADKRFQVIQLSTGKYRLSGPDDCATKGIGYKELAEVMRGIMTVVVEDGSPSYDPG